MAASDLGTGITCEFVSSAYSANVLAVEWVGIEREARKVTDLTDAYEEFLAGAESDAGTLALELAFNPDNTPPLSEDAETIRLTFPNLHQWVGTMFLSAFEFGAPLEDTMTARMELKVSGGVRAGSGAGGGLTLTPLVNPESDVVTVGGATVYAS